MDLFLRSIAKIRQRIENTITFTDRPLTNRDLFLNDIITTHFILGNEMYFYILKSKDILPENRMCKSSDIEGLSLGKKILSIELCSIKSTQFKRELKEIRSFIERVGD